MKALIVTPFVNKIGGVERFNNQIEQVLREVGFSVSYLSADSKLNTFKEKCYYYFLSSVATTYLKFKKISDKYDLIICNGEFGHGIKSDGPIINVFHGSYKGYMESKINYLNLKNRLSLRYMAFIQRKSAENKKVISVSNYLVSILNDQGIKVDQIIENGIDTDHFSPTENVKQKGILFVGKYDYYGKGIDILERMIDKGADISILPTESVDNIKLNILPATSYEDLPKLYNQFKFFVFPSRFESGGLAPLEAMSCGLPIVMSETGYGIDIKKKIPEFIIDFKDRENEDKYIEKINIINENHSYFSKAAREYVVKNFNNISFKSNWKSFLHETGIQC